MKKIIADNKLIKKLLTFLKNEKNTILSVIVVFCLPVLLYIQTLNYGFSYFDDNDIIINNLPLLSDLSNVPQAFLKNAIMGEGEHLYRPMQTLSYMTDIYVSGGYTWMFHLTNALLLGFIAGLLFLLLRKFQIPLKLAVLSTLIYCVHPLFTSSVAWIPARGDLLLMCFSLLSFLFFIEYLQRRRITYLLLNWLAFTIALFCKETAVVLPILFVVYYFKFNSEKHPDNFRDARKYLLLILLCVLSGVCWFWLRSIAIGNSSIQNEATLKPLLSNLPMIPESLASFFFPFSIDLFPSFSILKTLVGFGIIILILILFFTNKGSSKKEKIFCLSWFLLLLLPTLFYKIKFIDYLNHRFFLPLVGILLFILLTIPRKWSEKLNSKGVWLLASMVVLLASVTFVKSRSYSDPITFYNNAIAQNPKNALMYNNRGFVKLSTGSSQDAIDDYNMAVELSPDFALFYYNRGNAYSSLNDFDKAIEDYSKVITLNPKSADAYNNRGVAYKNRGGAYSNNDDFDKAISDFNKVITLNPSDADAYNNRGGAYFEKGDYESAVKDYDKTIALNPNYAVAYYNRGSAYKAMGKEDKAEPDFIKYQELTTGNSL